MPFLREAQPLMVKGIDFTVPSTFLPPGHAFPQNMHYEKGEIRKRDGKSTVGGVTLGAQKILHLFVAEDSAQSQTLFRFTKQNIEKYVSGSDTYSNVTGADLTGAETNFFDTAVVAESDVMVSCNYVDNLRKTNLVSGGNSSDVGGAPPKSKYVEYMTPYLLIAHLIDSGTKLPWTIRWSDSGNYQKWNGGNAGSIVLSHEPSAIRALKKLGNQVMCYKEKSIYRGNAVSTSAIFDFGGPFITDEGLYAPRGIAASDGVHYFMGLNDFYINDGVRRTSIGKAVRDHVFTRLDRALNETCFALPVEIYKEIWFFVTISGQSWPTEIWKYRRDLDLWYFDTIASATAAVNYKVVSSLTWDQASGTWNDQTSFWDAQSGSADSPIQVFGFTNGITLKRNENVVNDNGVAVAAYLETKDFSGFQVGGREHDVEWLQMELWARGNPFKVYYSTDYGTNWNFITTVTPTATTQRYDVFFDIFSPTIRFKFENLDAGKTFTLQNFTPYYIDDGEAPF